MKNYKDKYLKRPQPDLAITTFCHCPYTKPLFKAKENERKKERKKGQKRTQPCVVSPSMVELNCPSLIL